MNAQSHFIITTIRFGFSSIRFLSYKVQRSWQYSILIVIQSNKCNTKCENTTRHYLSLSLTLLPSFTRSLSLSLSPYEKYVKLEVCRINDKDSRVRGKERAVERGIGASVERMEKKAATAAKNYKW